MAKTKISEWDTNPSNNTDVAGVDIAEGCAPSGINNAIRQVMAQVKSFTTGASGDDQVVGGNLSVTGTTTLNDDLIVSSSSGTAGQALLSQGAGLPPIWGAAFVSGMIMMWSGSIATIPSGWLLCNGSSGTPDLRNKFIVGAGDTYAVGSSGGSADAIVVNHSHTLTDPGHVHQVGWVRRPSRGSPDSPDDVVPNPALSSGTPAMSLSQTTGITLASTGSSGTNANLPPYYALCYIMKS